MSTPISPDPDQQATAAVVVGIDGTAASDLAVRWAAEVAARRGRRLRIVHGLGLDPHATAFGIYELLWPTVTDMMRQEGADKVAAAQRLAHRLHPGLTVEIELSPAHPAQLLIQESRAAHLLAVGAAGGSGEIARMGSTMLAVTAHGHGNIVVVREADAGQQNPPAGPVVVGIDASQAGEPAIAAAFAEAATRATTLVAVHSATDIVLGDRPGLAALLPRRELDSTAHELLTEKLADWQQKFPHVHVIRKVYASAPSHQLLAWSKSAQLVVVGSRGRGGFRGLLLGSTSNCLAQYAHCPVMIAHPD